MAEKQSENGDLNGKSSNEKLNICNEFFRDDNSEQKEIDSASNDDIVPLSKLSIKDDRELENGPADIVFIVSGKRLPTHRKVLASKSEYFRALLLGGLAESQQDEITVEVPLEPFEILLDYLYSGLISFDGINYDGILELLDLANMYDIQNLLTIITMHFCQILNHDNVLAIFCNTSPYNLDKLQATCHKYIDRHGVDILRNDNFLFLPEDLVEEIISRKSFYAPEIEIFSAIASWAKSNPTIDLKPLLTHVRFSRMDERDLMNIVLPSSILTPDELKEYQEKESIHNYLPYRGLNVNEKLVMKSLESIEENVFVGYHNTSNNIKTIVVDLGNTYITNNIKMSLDNSTPYYIEISTNGKDWERVIDYTNCVCESSQELYFPVSPVALIRISNDIGRNENIDYEKPIPLIVKNLTFLYTKEVPEMINGYIKPVKDVVRRLYGSVLSGSLKQMYCPMYINAVPLIYVTERLGAPITVQMNQPYIIEKMGIYIWDYNNHPSSFYCESSLDNKKWTMLLDKRRYNLVDRNCFEFEPKPVIFLRFFGTPNPYNKSPNFCISKLECPPNDITMFTQYREIE